MFSIQQLDFQRLCPFQMKKQALEWTQFIERPQTSPSNYKKEKQKVKLGET